MFDFQNLKIKMTIALHKVSPYAFHTEKLPILTLCFGSVTFAGSLGSFRNIGKIIISFQKSLLCFRCLSLSHWFVYKTEIFCFGIAQPLHCKHFIQNTEFIWREKLKNLNKSVPYAIVTLTAMCLVLSLFYTQTPKVLIALQIYSHIVVLSLL